MAVPVRLDLALPIQTDHHNLGAFIRTRFSTCILSSG